MQNLYADGNTLYWTNSSGVDVAKDDVVVVGSLVGIATKNIANGDSGALNLRGVVLVPLGASETISQGQKLYAQGNSMAVTGTATSNTFAGHAYAAVDLATDEVYLRLAQADG